METCSLQDQTVMWGSSADAARISKIWREQMKHREAVRFCSETKLAHKHQLHSRSWENNVSSSFHISLCQLSWSSRYTDYLTSSQEHWSYMLVSNWSLPVVGGLGMVSYHMTTCAFALDLFTFEHPQTSAQWISESFWPLACRSRCWHLFIEIIVWTRTSSRKIN